MFITQLLFLFLFVILLTLIIWGLILCIRFEQSDNSRTKKLNKKKSTTIKLSITQEKIIHYIITIAIISAPLSYLFYQRINQTQIITSDWSIIGYTLLILISVLSLHSYLFPVVKGRFLCRWSNNYKHYLSKKKQKPKQLKLKF